MLGLAAVRVPRKTIFLPQGIELIGATGKHFMHIRLVRGIKNNGLARGIKYAVQRYGQFHHAQVGTQMSACDGNLINETLPNLCRKLFKLVCGQCLEILRRVNGIQDSHGAAFNSFCAFLPYPRRAVNIIFRLGRGTVPGRAWAPMRRIRQG